MLPFLTTVAVAVAMMGMLNSLHRFFIPALSPAMFNVATILCAFALVPLMPVGLPPIAGIAIGRCSAASARSRCSGRRCGGGLPLPADARLSRPGRARDPAADGPGTLGLAAVQINVLVNT